MPATIWRVTWPGEHGFTNTSRVRASSEAEAINKAHFYLKVPESVKVTAKLVQAEGSPVHKTQKQLKTGDGTSGNRKRRSKGSIQKDDVNPYTGTIPTTKKGWF